MRANRADPAQPDTPKNGENKDNNSINNENNNGISMTIIMRINTTITMKMRTASMERKACMAALEKASVGEDIGPFADFLARLVEKRLAGGPLPELPKG